MVLWARSCSSTACGLEGRRSGRAVLPKNAVDGAAVRHCHCGRRCCAEVCVGRRFCVPGGVVHGRRLPCRAACWSPFAVPGGVLVVGAVPDGVVVGVAVPSSVVVVGGSVPDGVLTVSAKHGTTAPPRTGQPQAHRQHAHSRPRGVSREPRHLFVGTPT